MSEFFPLPPGPLPSDPDPLTDPDPRLRRSWRLLRWEARAAQWRALELAREAFGEGVRARLEGGTAGGPFRGLLHLDVPFRDLETHRRREGRFLRWAGDDPVLSRVPLVFVFGALVPEPA